MIVLGMNLPIAEMIIIMQILTIIWLWRLRKPVKS